MVMPFTIKAQNEIIVNSINLHSIENGNYISIDFITSWGGTKLSIDYGQRHLIFNSRIAKGVNGKKLKFYSKIHAFNVLADNGWIYIDNYEYISGSDSEIETNRYLFKKLN